MIRSPVTNDELGAIIVLWLLAAGALWVQFGVARAVRPRLGGFVTLALVLLGLPWLGYLIVSPFLPPDPAGARVVVQVVTASLWVASLLIMVVVERREQRRLAMGRPGPLPTIIGVRRRDWLVIVIGATLLVVPRTVAAVAVPRPCPDVEVLLADRRPAQATLAPADWMPPAPQPGDSIIGGGPMDLDAVVASRVDGEAGRAALIEHGFVDAFRALYDGPAGGSSVTAQRFATPEGALAFDAYAARFACQFTTHTFSGPGDAVGLHIRYADDEAPFGEQYSWVSGDTRILVGVGGTVPFVDHARLDALAASVP